MYKGSIKCYNRKRWIATKLLQVEDTPTCYSIVLKPSKAKGPEPILVSL